jgi:short-subunit dehydrogenase
MKINFKGKIVVVTGASSGIGYATALKFQELGAKLVLVARRRDKLNQLKEIIQSNGGEALVIATDVSSLEEVQKMADQIIIHYGKVDILIANAGQYIQSSIINSQIEDFERSMAVNFYGIVYVIKSLLPSMNEEQSGNIVIVNSLDAKKGVVGDAPYVSAKSALDGFGDVLRQELAGIGINVISVFPGRVDTAMVEGLSVPWISPKMHADKVVGAIIKGIRRNKATVCVPGFYSSLGAMNNVFPRFLDWVYAKFKLEGKWEK